MNFSITLSMKFYDMSLYHGHIVRLLLLSTGRGTLKILQKLI
jgi:hypothetical protein